MNVQNERMAAAKKVSVSSLQSEEIVNVKIQTFTDIARNEFYQKMP